MARVMEVNGKECKAEGEEWSEEKLHLENARKLRGNFIDPEDTEFKETMKNIGETLRE